MSFPAGSILDPNDRITVNINGATFQVWDEGREEMYAHSGSSTQKAVWTCRCLWDDRRSLAAALLGGGTNLAGTNLYLDGWPYPDNPAWVCQTVQTKGDGLIKPGTTLIDYQRSLITATFGIPDFNMGTPNTGEQELDFSSDAVALNQGASSLVWVSDGTDVPSSQYPTLRYTTVQFRQSVFNRAVLPVQTIFAYIDCVNSDVFFGANAGHVLFKGARSRRNITANGTTNWSIDYSFVASGYGWNYQPRAGQIGSKTWQQVKFKTTNEPLYASANFANLLSA